MQTRFSLWKSAAQSPGRMPTGISIHVWAGQTPRLGVKDDDLMADSPAFESTFIPLIVASLLLGMYVVASHRVVGSLSWEAG